MARLFEGLAGLSVLAYRTDLLAKLGIFMGWVKPGLARLPDFFYVIQVQPKY